MTLFKIIVTITKMIKKMMMIIITIIIIIIIMIIIIVITIIVIIIIIIMKLPNNTPETWKYWVDVQQGIVSYHGEREPL